MRVLEKRLPAFPLPKGGQCPPDFRQGFTLLEVLVVLILLGVLTSLALPRLLTAYESIQAAYDRDEVLAQLGLLGYRALRLGRGFELGEYPFPPELPPERRAPLELPEGWSLRAEPPIRYQASGVCRGGQVELRYASQLYALDLKPPFCRPELL